MRVSRFAPSEIAKRALLICAIVNLTVFAAAADPVASQLVIKLGTPRIIHGENADIQDHLWQVAIVIRKSSGSYLCGGSLIGQRRILTAAHCFDPTSQPTDVLIKAGVTHFLTEGSWISAKQISRHPQFDPKSYSNDIAVVWLDAAPQGKVIPIADQTLVIPDGEPLEITGWGATSEAGSAANELQRAIVPYVRNSECNDTNAYAGAVTSEMMCAGHRDGGIDSCQGDSGGPLVWQGIYGPILVGVVSFGSGCAKKLRYGVYSRVSAYQSWISTTLQANSLP